MMVITRVTLKSLIAGVARAHVRLWRSHWVVTVPLCRVRLRPSGVRLRRVQSGWWPPRSLSSLSGAPCGARAADG